MLTLQFGKTKKQKNLNIICKILLHTVYYMVGTDIDANCSATLRGASKQQITINSQEFIKKQEKDP